MADTHRRFATPKVYSDLPLLEPDYENEEAFFRFKEYAITFTRLIAARETRTPLVIGLSGKWGSGKTTLLRMIRDRLNETARLKPDLRSISWIGDDDEAGHFRRCRTVWFNAWKYGDADSLLAALIRTILEEMSRGDWKDQLKGAALDKFFPRRDVLATFAAMFNFKLAIGDSGIEFAPDLDKYKTETPFAKHKAFLDDFGGAFDQLLAAWVHSQPEIDPAQGVLVVLIDDLDRCLPAKTVQVLEAVKLFLDKRGVCFVIGADEGVIREAVKAHYRGEKVMAGEAAPDALADKVLGEEAGKYLEKIIQVRFSLPPLRSAQLSEYMRTGLSLSPELQKSVDLIVAGSETNPRRLKTTLNYLQLNWALLQNSGQASADLQDDFLLWSLIELAAPNFAEQARNIPDLDLRLKFVTEALLWAKYGDRADWLEKNAALAGQYNAYLGNQRLRRILQQGQFTQRVEKRVLDQFVYWSASAPEADSRVIEETGTAVASAIASGKDVLIRKLGGIDFVEIPAGKFLMGSRDDNINAQDRDNEKPQHTVEITRPYRIGLFPVTNAQYREFAEAGRTGWKTEKPDDHPAAYVSWKDAAAYCDWLTKKLRDSGELPGNEVIRLPTEAEWEKAARGEYGNEWPWGNEFDAAKCNTEEDGKRGTTPVGAYSPAGDSPYGVADMAGNVWEWCADWYSDDEYKRRAGREVKDPTGPQKGDYHALRGGAWHRNLRYARCAYRLRSYLSVADVDVGFRVVAASPVSR